MSELIRRRQRKRADTSDPFIELSTKSLSPPQDIEPTSADVPPTNSEPITEEKRQLPVSSSAADKQRYIDRICAEIIEDNHHCDLADSEYWDGSHNRSSSYSEPLSDEYCHFLGGYE
ncbi:hypothetical protein [Myxosarcina sp. GI1]|uniref:hypothetical protein n=1 Tax=Myxosarcina sp. GI1 TaxID=1541065 RepID=UPI00055E76BE|nr:hypothetical protein [Myxosarcina sp. GI1]